MVSHCVVIENSEQFDDLLHWAPSVGAVCSKISIRVCGLLDVCKAWPCRNSSLRPSIWVAHCTFLIRQSRLAQVSVLNRAPDVFDFNSVFWSPWSRTVGDLGVSSVNHHRVPYSTGGPFTFLNNFSSCDITLTIFLGGGQCPRKREEGKKKKKKTSQQTKRARKWF